MEMDESTFQPPAKHKYKVECNMIMNMNMNYVCRKCDTISDVKMNKSQFQRIIRFRAARWRWMSRPSNPSQDINVNFNDKNYDIFILEYNVM